MSEIQNIQVANAKNALQGSHLTPKEIVKELDKHIIGQADAKRAVAIALRNRWRRMQLPKLLRDEIMPKNILMIGPTGVGKTEIARRVAKLADAPFIKIEATKFTEVGYVGRDVESIIRDLMDIAIKRIRDKETENVRHKAEKAVEEKILDALLPQPNKASLKGEPVVETGADKEKDDDGGDGSNVTNAKIATREVFRKKLREKKLEDSEIEIEVSAAVVGVEIMAPPGMEEMTNQLQSMFQSLSSDRKKTRKLKVSEARKLLLEEKSNELIDNEAIKSQALTDVEQNSIVFLDELDKIARRSENKGADVSREGVQRDLLPLIEGCTVSTRYGMVRTDHILFIASGAFHYAKPSDLIPELQGRLPIRVELKALGVDEFIRILTEPTASLTEQYVELIATEGVKIEFFPDGVKRIAEVAWFVNERTENIGARRLQTVMEKLLEEISFEASNLQGKSFQITASYVDKHLEHFVRDEDLSRYIL